MCPFCIGAAAWAAAGVLTTAGLGTLFAATIRGGDETGRDGDGSAPASPSGDHQRRPTS